VKRACRDWVESLSIKQQCQLFSAMRGPDVGKCARVKRVVRWFRSLVVHAVEGGHYTRIGGKLPKPKSMTRQAEWLTAHYVNHFAEALHVVARFHPDRTEQSRAWGYLEALLKDVAPIVRDLE
jgi:hypothetical protein